MFCSSSYVTRVSVCDPFYPVRDSRSSSILPLLLIYKLLVHFPFITLFYSILIRILGIASFQ